MTGMDEQRKTNEEWMNDDGARRSLEAASAALLKLVEYGVPIDIQSLLIQGSKTHGVRPGALVAALSAALGVYNRLS
jgi:hypothetical protein